MFVHHKKNPIWIFPLIVSLLAAGVFFRFYNLDKKVYWYDEAHTSLWISGYRWSEVKQILCAHEMSIEEVIKFQHINPGRGLRNTISSLSKEDPQHPPLYYGLVRLWAGLFGDSTWIVRSFSAFIGLLIFPCLYWLCCELFKSRRVAWIAVTLVAVSPFHVLYAQEARQYSMWTVTIVLSSAALLRALRLQSKYAWVLYSMSVILGIYTHTLFALLVIAHGVYMFVGHISETEWFPMKLPKNFVAYIMATLAGLSVFLPWAYIIITNLSRAKRNLSWMNKEVNPFYLVGMWGFNFSSVFYDAGYTLDFIEQYDIEILFSYSIRAFLLILMTCSIFFLYSKAPQRICLFVFTLIGIPFFMLALPDLFLGGLRSGWGNRLLIPSYIGIELAVASLLAAQTNTPQPGSRRLWIIIMATVITCGIISCVISSQAETWWTKPSSYHQPRMARIINHASHPLLVIAADGNLLSFSHLLKPEIRIHVVGKANAFRVPKGFSDVFVFKPSSELHKKLQQANGFNLESVDKPGGLWRLTKQ